jgi:uncharacterized protein (DUF58 family)
MRTRTAHSPHFTAITAVLFAIWFVVGEAHSRALERSLRLTIVVVAIANFGLALARVRRVSVRVVSQPTRLLVGDSAALGLEVTGAGSGVRLRMSSSDRAPWVLAAGDGIGSLPGTAEFRGVATEVMVQLRSDGPLGILGYSQTRTLELRPIYVGPRPEAPDRAVDLRAGMAASRVAVVPIDDVPSVIREYQPGDPLRRISWPATARAGRLMTRDYELGTERDLHLVVDLGETPGEAAEHAAAVGAWVGGHALERGWRLHLVVRGPDGELSGPVDAVVLHCNLALAECGPVTLPADRPFLLVSPSGAEWR